jgi:hypothetical protein
VIQVESEDDGFIRVWDNAAGIGADDYERAFVTAEPPPNSAGLSQFGIGLKSASCWFARQWRVTTTALGEPVQRTVDFDVPKIIRNAAESLDVRVKSTNESEHWTEVRLWDLYKPPQTQTIGKMRQHLTSMYREFLRRGDIEIEFNGQLLRYVEPPILEAPLFSDASAKPKFWRKEIEFTLPTGEEVKGFAALREKGSTKFAGFALFRHGRLIIGSDDDTYRPAEIFGGSNSYAYQRLFGELHLDDFDVSHTKDAFIWGDSEAIFLERLRRAVDSRPLPLLKQADGYRARTAPANMVKAATTAVARTAVALEDVGPVIERQLDAGPDDKLPPKQYPPGHDVGRRTLELDVRGQRWTVSIDLTSDPAAREWLEITDKSSPKGNKRTLGIRLSVSHPFTQRFGGANAEQVEGLIRVATGVAIAEVTAREAGVQQAGTIRRNLNELLLNTLSGA